MRGLVAGLVLGIAVLTAACHGSAGASPDGGQSAGVGASPLGSPVAVRPSPTIGYCGMDPEPVPCVDRPADDPQPTSAGPIHELAGTCEQQASADRCQALALAAADQLGVGFDQIASVDIVPNPSPDGTDFAHRTFLQVTLESGDRADVVIGCPGVSGAYDPKCMAQPVVPIWYPRGPEGGYTDTPGDATPFPSLDPAAVSAAIPLRIKSLVIPVGGLGPHTLTLGRASLPNGYLTQGSFAMADPWPSDVLFKGITLVVTPTAGGAPLQNLYEHGWHSGTEEVEATLTFNVVWFKPGARFTIVNVVVR